VAESSKRRSEFRYNIFVYLCNNFKRVGKEDANYIKNTQKQQHITLTAMATVRTGKRMH
jgi:hypothetical protein